MVVKIQRALEASEPNPPILVYNRDRSFEAFLPMTKDLEDMFETYGLEKWGKCKLFADVTLVKREVHINGAIAGVDLGW